MIYNLSEMSLGAYCQFQKDDRYLAQAELLTHLVIISIIRYSNRGNLMLAGMNIIVSYA